MFKRLLTGVVLMAAEVIPFPTGDELEQRKKESAGPATRSERKAKVRKRKEEKERKEKNNRILQDVKKPPK